MVAVVFTVIFSTKKKKENERTGGLTHPRLAVSRANPRASSHLSPGPYTLSIGFCVVGIEKLLILVPLLFCDL